MSFKVRCWAMTVLFAVATLVLHLVSHGEPEPLAHPLSSFPSSLGAWQSRDEPFDKEIVKAVAMDDYINRIYMSPQQPPMLLYIGYYKSQRTGQTIHSPKNCLPGSGWEPIESGVTLLRAANGGQVRVNSYLIEKGLDRQIVLYWYQSHGRVIASEYWGKIYMVKDALQLNRTDAALIRVITPVVKDAPEARLRATRFAEEVLANSSEISPR